VDVDTRRSDASMVENASTSNSPISRGWRTVPVRPCHRAKNLIQYTWPEWRLETQTIVLTRSALLPLHKVIAIRADCPSTSS
jgi:hypothetical protein